MTSRDSAASISVSDSARRGKRLQHWGRPLTGDGLNLLTVDWKNVVSVAGLAAVVSVLTSVRSGPFSRNGRPNLVRPPRKAVTPAASSGVDSGAGPTVPASK